MMADGVNAAMNAVQPAGDGAVAERAGTDPDPTQLRGVITPVLVGSHRCIASRRL
jgi:hypothetical protein